MADYTRRKIRISRVVEVVSSDHYSTLSGSDGAVHSYSVQRHDTKPPCAEGDRGATFIELVHRIQAWHGWDVEII